MYLIETDGYITGYSSSEPTNEKFHEVADDSKFYTFFETYKPFTKIKVNVNGVMSYEEDSDRKELQERIQFKEEREIAVGTSTVEYDGMVFDSGEVSQNRMLRPIAVLQNDTDTQMWVLHDNSVVYLKKYQFLAVLELAGLQQSSLWVQP